MRLLDSHTDTHTDRERHRERLWDKHSAPLMSLMPQLQDAKLRYAAPPEKTRRAHWVDTHGVVRSVVTHRYAGPGPVAYRQMLHLSSALLGDEGISDAVQRAASRFIANITSTQDVPPSVGVDEDGNAVLHWLAGDISLIVDVDETGPVYGWLSAGSDVRRASAPSDIYVLASDGVRSVTSTTDWLNPHWRDSER